MDKIQILEDFAQFKKGQIVTVDNSYTPTSRKACERYIQGGKAKPFVEPKSKPSKKEETSK